MTPSDEKQAPRQTLRFLLLYALAAAGGAVAYVPVLVLLLPVRVGELAGDADAIWLGYLTFFGAVAASLGNIAFGWLSDVTSHRRGWIATGLLLSCGLLLALGKVRDLPALIATLIAWQLALNMMLGPLLAWAGDCVPDEQKGLLGGLLAFSPAVGAAAGVAATLDWVDLDEQLLLVATLVTVLVAPVLLFGSPRPMPQLMRPLAPGERTSLERTLRRSAAARMWLARLLVQIAQAALFAFLLFWFRSIEPRMGAAETARLLSIVLAIAVPTAILVGRWSDRHARPILPLAICAYLLAGGLLLMAFAQTLALAIAGYVLFTLVSAIFLALHASQTLRVLPRPDRRGRDMGVFNLTNTIPSVIMSWLALALVPSFGFDALFMLLAGLAAVAGMLLATMPRSIVQVPQRAPGQGERW